MDTTKNFDGYAKDYTVGRPSYAAELIDYLFNNCNLNAESVIADIGSGTGKLSRQFLERGCRVYAVEPNNDMRHTSEIELADYERFYSVLGDAENTTLEDDSVDFITTAQAFHWFNGSQFRRECKRILKSSGRVALIWNVRDMTDLLNQDLYNIYSKYCPQFKGFSGGIKKDDQRIKDFFNDHYTYVSFDNPLYFDRDKFIARSLSGSYSLKEGDRDFNEYMDAINELFDKYSKDGIVVMANSSDAYIGDYN